MQESQGQEDKAEGKVWRWKVSLFFTGLGGGRSRRSFGLARGRQRIPSLVGDAQGIKPIAGISGEGEHHVRGSVGTVLVQPDLSAHKMKVAMGWKKCAVGMGW